MLAARRLAAVVVIAVLAMVGCSEEPEPRFAEPTASGSPATPSATEGGEETTGSGDPERDLVTSFFAEVSESIQSGDTDPWLALTTGDCANCQTLAANLESAYADGGSIRGGGWTLVDAEFLREDADGRVWSATVESDRERWVDASGGLVKVVRPETFTFEVALRRSDGELAVGGIRTRAV